MKRRSNKRSSNRSTLDKSQVDSRGDLPRVPVRTYRTSSIPVPRTTQQVTFRQLVDFTDLVAQATSTTQAQYNFTLSTLDFSSNFVNLFDQWRIDAVKFSIVPTSNAIQVVTQSTTNMVQLYCVIDYDDSSALGTVAQARGYDNCIELQPGESLERTFQPRAALSAYSGSFGSFANIGGGWFDSGSTGVQHYGIKVIIPGATAAQTLLQTWRVFAEIYVSFRTLR